MVGFDPKKKKNLSQTQQAVVSSVTSICSRCLIQPFDVIKIRFQVNYLFFLRSVLNVFKIAVKKLDTI